MIEANRLLEPLRAFLPRQRWYSGSAPPASLSVVDEAVWRDGSPGLLDLIVDADGAHYQVTVGIRSSGERPDFLRGRDEAVIGDVDSWLAYDATLDAELGLTLVDVVSRSAESAERVRPVPGEQSNSSLVYDDRLILKIFRRVHPGRNLDVEMTEALSDAGFDHVARPLAVYTRNGYDLAVLQPFLAGGADGWALALTSLRDLFGVGDTQPVPVITDDLPPPVVDPAEAGGDFSAEASRLGTITAEMHAALAGALGRERGDASAWVDAISQQLQDLDAPELDLTQTERVIEALRRVPDPGPATRVHGDYHLGQVLRTDAGWFVLDFEGEPARPPQERRQPSSPLKDVAGMLRSFHYASQVALQERDEDCAGLAAAWEARNRKAFLEGYMGAAAQAGLLPLPPATETVLAAFELEKAMYELKYERAYRPSWQTIPLAALHRLGAS